MGRDREWRQFEQAVAAFIAALDPKAHVRHDTRTRDKHTRKPRQRDVWIETSIGGLIPLSVLVSCKRRKRPLDQQHVDAFHGELLAAGASKGVLYSFSGFTTDAVAKAKFLGIECCRLYETKPPEIPEALPLQVYVCRAAIALVPRTISPDWNIATFAQLFAIEAVNDSGELTTVREAIIERYNQEMQAAAAKCDGRNAFPPDWSKIIALRDEAKGSIEVSLHGVWQIYAAAVDAQLLDGTYNYTSGRFVGSQFFRVPAAGPDPGPGWILLTERPDTKGTAGVTMIQHMSDLTVVLDRIAARKIGA